MKKVYDKIILGAGMYGLYSAYYCGQKGQHILVLDVDYGPFKRATYINQARVHMGYHYPRSYSTAIKSRNYFERFVNDFDFCIEKSFKKIYATSSCFSWTNAKDFEKFCVNTNTPCNSINPLEYFNKGVCDGAFETIEYTYDANILMNFFMDNIRKNKDTELCFGIKLLSIKKDDDSGLYEIKYMGDGSEYMVYTPFLLNTTYASVNQVLNLAGFDTLKIKYELCEIILCNVDKYLKEVGITVMDGPFFSIMPFGKTGLHSLTSVTFTPHITSYSALPRFDCQKNKDSFCSENQLANCNECNYKPESAYLYMSKLAKKYLNDKYSNFVFNRSLFSIKPILQSSEIDDSRPTVIKKYSSNPIFVSVLSGKINTVYDLDEVLDENV